MKVKLENGEVPLENIKLKNVFQTVFEKEIQVEEETEDQLGIKFSLTTPELTAGVKEREKSGEKLRESEYQVITGGTLEEPTWVFDVKN